MKRLCPHLLFVLAAAACVYLPLLAMLIVREGPVSFVLFCFPPITSIPLFALGLGACLFITGWDTSILIYVFIYLLIGGAAMAITHLVRQYRKRS